MPAIKGDQLRSRGTQLVECRVVSWLLISSRAGQKVCGILVACGKDTFQFVLCEKYILRLAYCPFYCPFFDQTLGEIADFGDYRDSWRPH